MKKKFLLSFILMCVSIFAFGMLTVSAETTGTYGYLTYKIENGEVAITDCSQSATNIVIPYKIEETPVTCIDVRAFQECYKLTDITIPDSVRSIQAYAFEGSFNITSITIPDSVTYIGPYAFMGCSGLQELTIGENVSYIENDAFYNCIGLTKINWNAKSTADLSDNDSVLQITETKVAT